MTLQFNHIYFCYTDVVNCYLLFMVLLLCVSRIVLLFVTEVQEIFQPHIPIYITLTMSQHLKAQLQANCAGVIYFINKTRGFFSYYICLRCIYNFGGNPWIFLRNELSHWHLKILTNSTIIKIAVRSMNEQMQVFPKICLEPALNYHKYATDLLQTFAEVGPTAKRHC